MLYRCLDAKKVTDGSPESESIIRLLIEVDGCSTRMRATCRRISRRRLPEVTCPAAAIAAVAAAVALAAGCRRRSAGVRRGHARAGAQPRTRKAAALIASGAPIERGWRADSSVPIWLSGWALEDPAKPASEWVVIELAAPGDRALFRVSMIRNPTPSWPRAWETAQAWRRRSIVARADMLPRGAMRSGC
jgi:hypothetical protein